MFRHRLMLCAATGAATLGIASLVVQAHAFQASSRPAAVSAPSLRTTTASTQAAPAALQQPGVHTSQPAQSPARSAAVASSVSRTAAVPARPTAPQDIFVRDPLGIACIDVGAAGCEAKNVAVSTGGPAKACGNPHIALSPFTGEVESCP